MILPDLSILNKKSLPDLDQLPEDLIYCNESQHFSFSADHLVPDSSLGTYSMKRTSQCGRLFLMYTEIIKGFPLYKFQFTEIITIILFEFENVPR